MVLEHHQGDAAIAEFDDKDQRREWPMPVLASRFLPARIRSQYLPALVAPNLPARCQDGDSHAAPRRKSA